jgi:hypothetical protein
MSLCQHFLALRNLLPGQEFHCVKNGYGEIINHLRRELPKMIRQEFSEENKQKLAEVSSQTATGLEEALTKLQESIKNMALIE